MGGHHAKTFSHKGHWSSSQHPGTLSLCDQRWKQRKSFIGFPGWQYFSKMSPLRSYCFGEFPGSLVVRTLNFRCRELGFYPSSGELKFLHASWRGQQNQKKLKKCTCLQIFNWGFIPRGTSLPCQTQLVSKVILGSRSPAWDSGIGSLTIQTTIRIPWLGWVGCCYPEHQHDY